MESFFSRIPARSVSPRDGPAGSRDGRMPHRVFYIAMQVERFGNEEIIEKQLRMVGKIDNFAIDAVHRRRVRKG